MEIHLKPETESRLKELASKSGRPVDDLLEDAMAAYFIEVAASPTLDETRRRLSGRQPVQPHPSTVAAVRAERKSR